MKWREGEEREGEGREEREGREGRKGREEGREREEEGGEGGRKGGREGGREGGRGRREARKGGRRMRQRMEGRETRDGEMEKRDRGMRGMHGGWRREEVGKKQNESHTLTCPDVAKERWSVYGSRVKASPKSPITQCPYSSFTRTLADLMSRWATAYFSVRIPSGAV